MNFAARFVKSAQLNAASEMGKYSPSYLREALTCQFHPDDLDLLGVKVGNGISCTSASNGITISLVVATSRYVAAGTVNVMRTPWTRNIAPGTSETVEVDINKTTGMQEDFNATIKKIREAMGCDRVQ